MLPRVLLAISTISHSLILSARDQTLMTHEATHHVTFPSERKTKAREPLLPPEEHSHSGAAGGGVGGARSHVLPVQLSETAGALRAQHGAAEQAQGGVLPLVVAGLGTPEGSGRAVSQRCLTTSCRRQSGKGFSAADLLEMTGLIQQSAVILRKINQMILSPRVSGVKG